MKIGHPAPGVLDAAPPASAGSVRPATDEAARTAPAIGTDGTDKVELSATAAGLMSGVKGAPAEIDAAKVQRISQAIADGSFKVNPEAIADKLIANAREVLGSVKR